MTSESPKQPEKSSASLDQAANTQLNQPITHQPIANVPAASSSNASSGLPAVGDLSKLNSETPPPLELGNPDNRQAAPQIEQVTQNPAQKPAIAIPTNPSGLPFAASQAVPAEAIPAALAAKEAEQANNNDATEAASDEGSEASGAVKSSETKPETPAPPAESQPAPALVEGNHAPQVRFKNEQGKLLLVLPSEKNDSSGQNTLSYAWTEIMNQLRQRLQAEARHWEANTAVHLIARDRLLSAQQLQDIVEALATTKMQLRRVYTSRRQTATTAATAGYSVEQHVAVSQLNPAPNEAGNAMAEPLVLKSTLRSGVEIRHNGTVVVIGDLNPGSAIIAQGDIVVWGRLRGNVHAGYQGDGQARIMALRMEPAQIRIAGFVARGPSNPPTQFFPEVAYVTAQGKIRIARVEDLREVPGQIATGQPPTGRKMPATGRRRF